MRRKARPIEVQREINIVPYLDIMVNLVMFMLMSMTGFVTFQMINVNAPDVADASVQADPTVPPPKDQDQPFVLNVSISERGFYIAATGGLLTGDAEEAEEGKEEGKAAPTIPLKGGEYDFAALEAKMGEIKSRWPDKSQVILAADAKIRYEVVVQTMDAMRGDSSRLLFPDVAFAAVGQ